MKASTLARMRLAAAGAAVLAGGIVGCGKQPAPHLQREPRGARTPSFLAADPPDGGKPRPREHECEACGMG